MGFFSDLGSIAGGITNTISEAKSIVTDTKTELTSSVSEVGSILKDTTDSMSQISDQVKGDLSGTVNDVKDKITNPFSDKS